jgi:hydrogenase nickel incorporation protein HypA/HybF
MHEMSLIIALMDRVEEELRAHGASRLRLARVRCGALSRVVPAVMRTAFAAATRGTPHEGARLEIVEEAISLRCPACGRSFSPEGGHALFQPCPHCGSLADCRMESGKGVFLDHLEAE